MINIGFDLREHFVDLHLRNDTTLKTFSMLYNYCQTHCMYIINRIRVQPSITGRIPQYLRAMGYPGERNIPFFSESCINPTFTTCKKITNIYYLVVSTTLAQC